MTKDIDNFSNMLEANKKLGVLGCSPKIFDCLEMANDSFLDDILNAVEIDGQRFLCITRPRRFGKSVMAHMVGAFLGKTADSGSTFDHLAAAKS